MSGVNKVILVGHVGKDPEVRYLEGGVAVARFSLATSESYKNKNGEKVEQTEWHNITVWRQLAEIVDKYVRKGQLLYIEGKIRTRSVGEEGNKKYFTDIIADQMTMLGAKRDAQGGNPGGQYQPAETPPSGSVSEPKNDFPF
jgi:single-strand DNA-binding protein